MDPRMDSGAAREDYPKVSFDPSSRLLPEEVCWIIDRLFAAEVSSASCAPLSYIPTLIAIDVVARREFSSSKRLLLSLRARDWSRKAMERRKDRESLTILERHR